MKNFYRYGLTALATSLLSANVFASSLVGVTGTLKNVEKQINVAIQQAEKLYEENKGQALVYPGFNLLKPGNQTANPYLMNFYIQVDYKISMRLYESVSASPSVGEGVQSPIAKALGGKKFVFIPIIDYGDEVITSWECVTDADEGVQQFVGDTGAKLNTRSYIAAATTNKYLSNCIYVSTGDMTSFFGSPPAW